MIAELLFDAHNLLNFTTDLQVVLTGMINFEASTMFVSLCRKYIFWFLFDIAITNSYILTTLLRPLLIKFMLLVTRPRVILMAASIGHYRSRDLDSPVCVERLDGEHAFLWGLRYNEPLNISQKQDCYHRVQLVDRQ